MVTRRQTNNTDDERHPWEFHEDWESYTAYSRFLKFFLSLTPPRSYMDAFREYKRSLGWTDEQIAKIKKLDGNWERWVKGDAENNIPSWKERAIAYDIYRQTQIDLGRDSMRIRLFERNLKQVERLQNKWEELFGIAENLRVSGRRKIKVTGADGKPTEQIVEILELNVGQFRELVRALDDITIQHRRLLNLPSDIKQTNLADNDGGKIDGRGMVDGLAGLFQEWQNQKRISKKSEGESDGE